MANLHASKKNIRKIEKQTERNRQVKSRLKTLAKKVQTSAAAGDAAASKAVAVEYVACLDKAAKRNVIHSNRADRQKSAVSKFIFAA
ncbi:MAG: 30S ribosomal protein S20 [Verrucomicrobia bacterium 21-51-4]|nr:MAG: 30S ribosomal protein S20 [Verrucomicrobia bacterium 21-51-4]